MPAQPKAAKSYGQYCPLALAAELLCRRWTLLVVSRLLDGCTTFTEIHRGVPRISPSLLTTRLAELEHAGLVHRCKRATNERFVYELTEAGRDLDDIVMQLAIWGQHWARDNDMEDLDLAFLAWSVSQRLDVDAMPTERVVLEFEFSGAPRDFRRFWLVSVDRTVDMCIKHPGLDTDLLIRSDLKRFVEVWRGFRDLGAELKASRITLIGDVAMKKALPNWLQLSALSKYPRKRSGNERRVSEGNR